MALAAERLTSGLAPGGATVDDWLVWQQQLHPRAIDLGVERVAAVLKRLGIAQLSMPVIAVAGTNGKGSTVAFLQAILRCAGYRVGAYTSPHLLSYNERICIDGAPVADDLLCQAFASVEVARDRLSLSFFEFGTVAALLLFQQADLDVIILEVGLGGRLDAVNAVAADVAVITSVDLDHTDWLGNDREAIGFEKAGIFRSAKPAIYAALQPPASVLQHADNIGAGLCCYGKDYDYEKTISAWYWYNSEVRLKLPLPGLLGEHQLNNAAAAVAVLRALTELLPVDYAALQEGIATASVPGRFEIVPGPIECILDVAHNPHAAQALANNLQQRDCQGRTLAVLGMLYDKDTVGVANALSGEIDYWYAARLGGERELRGEQLAERLRDAGINAAASFVTVSEAYAAALGDAVAGDRIVVFGSLQTVSAVMKSGLIGGLNCG